MFDRLKRLSATAAATALVLFGLLGAAVPPASAAGYFSGIDDLPIPDALSEVPEESVVFESPGGRIVTAVAQGEARAADVRAYYEKALPPLGWEPRGADRYVREDETLSFAYDVAGGRITVRIRLAPSAGGN